MNLETSASYKVTHTFKLEWTWEHKSVVGGGSSLLTPGVTVLTCCLETERRSEIVPGEMA